MSFTMGGYSLQESGVWDDQNYFPLAPGSHGLDALYLALPGGSAVCFHDNGASLYNPRLAQQLVAEIPDFEQSKDRLILSYVSLATVTALLSTALLVPLALLFAGVLRSRTA
jgi:hypothetical protein